MEFISKTTEETKRFSKSIASKLKPGDILALYGDLGSGKTTFTRYLVEELGIPSRVQSPTFVIVRKHHGGIGNIKTVNHVDLYRLTSQEEINEIGISELFKEKDSITVIEWPELIEETLPKVAIKIYFKYLNENERKIYVQNFD